MKINQEKVLVPSSMHKSVEIEKRDKRLSEAIAFYNNTKFVNMINQMTRKYSIKFKSCRWLFKIFFNILDLTKINAWVLYKETRKKYQGRIFVSASRRTYYRISRIIE